MLPLLHRLLGCLQSMPQPAQHFCRHRPRLTAGVAAVALPVRNQQLAGQPAVLLGILQDGGKRQGQELGKPLCCNRPAQHASSCTCAACPSQPTSAARARRVRARGSSSALAAASLARGGKERSAAMLFCGPRSRTGASSCSAAGSSALRVCASRRSQTGPRRTAIPYHMQACARPGCGTPTWARGSAARKAPRWSPKRRARSARGKAASWPTVAAPSSADTASPNFPLQGETGGASVALFCKQALAGALNSN